MMNSTPENRPFKKSRLWVAALIITVIAILFHFALQSGLFTKLFSVLEPILIGLCLAYLLNPLVKLLEKCFFKLFGKRAKKKGKLQKFCRALAVLLSILLALGLISLIVYLIIPQLYATIAGLVGDLPTMIENTIQWYNRTVDGNEILQSLGDSLFTGFKNWVKGIDTATILNTLLKFTSGAYVAVVTIVHIIIGFILAIYLLYSRETLCAQAKRLCYALFDNDKVNAVLRTTREGHKIMSRFIIGKLIDSVIVGVLCFILMLILRLPYALLVSVVIGVTNVIPYFGPFIGGIPSALLILLTDPIQGLTFIIMILILQQVDGNFIGPKILGDRIGLPPFWVMFAIIVGGGLFGFLGMVLGVPMLAIIFFVMRQISDRRLEAKSMPTALDAYVPEGDYVPQPTADEEEKPVES